MGLKIYLLGQFKLLAVERRIELPSRPAQSLLAYLALNAGVNQRREKLAALLWPEATDSNARSYLRQALWRIRKALQNNGFTEEDYLQVSDISITFDNQANYWLDAAQLLDSAESQSLETLKETLHLYQGELLPGFYDEWVIAERDRLENAYNQKMNLLIERLLDEKQWSEVLAWGEQWIRLGYAPEPAFRALMLAHANSGDLGMVTTTYQRCVESLNRELEPSPETQHLYERIRQRELEEHLPPPTHINTPGIYMPAFLDENEIQPYDRPIFVARERELAQLEEQLELALEGEGRVVFITGEAGSGKTALIQEFTRYAQEARANLIVASGNCNAHTGIGDPYLPFREILELLTGDVEARWAAGVISGAHARTLWRLLPITTEALVENGLELVDTFVPGKALVERASACVDLETDWLTRLENYIDYKTKASMIPGPQQSDLFEQYRRVIGTLGQKSPLVLVIDDLQWADTGSVGLLFHLGRQLVGCRILLLGAFRPEEIAFGRDGERHPLDPVISEFQRQFGEMTVDLSQAERREFVESLIDSELNQLGPSFRQMLYQQTHGHPLFTVELFRGMQERGDVVKDKDDQWIEAAALDWKNLPARVEAVIAERIKRLPQPMSEILRVASVEGEEFSAEVVARVLERDKREVVRQLSSELDRKHQLIRAQAIERLGAQRLSRYRFRHYLCQKYLYETLDPVERSYLHEDVGIVLEELYDQQVQAIAPQLAHHFQEAGITNKAIHYLHQAGEKAVALSAYHEAVTHLKQGLALLMTLPESQERDELELTLLLSLGKAVKGRPAKEWRKTLTRALEVCQKTGKTVELCQIFGELATVHYVRGELSMARRRAEEALSAAQQTSDPSVVALAHWFLGFVLFSMGEYTSAREHLMEMIAFYDPQQHHEFYVLNRGSDPGVSAMAYEALCLWCLGYPDQASQRSQEALVLARDLEHPFSEVDVICYAGCVFDAIRRYAVELKNNADRLRQISLYYSFPGWSETALCYQGSALFMLGQVEESVTRIREGLEGNRSTGVMCHMAGALGILSEAQATLGQYKQAKDTLEEGLAIIQNTDERHWEAELYRLKAVLLLMNGDEIEAEASLQKSIDVARQQKAKSWELRTTTDLASLWASQGKRDEAYKLLAPIYDWFTEGFDTPDLIAARRLLKELA